jgi:ketosteroid isomerase-like protein
MTLDEPAVVAEIAALFAAYTRAIGANDVAALNGYFHDSAATVRFGNAENLFGHAEIAGYRAGVRRSDATPPKRERTVIRTFGRDFATVATLNRMPGTGRVGRTMQSWVRVPEGWRIVAAHVSTIETPES